MRMRLREHLTYANVMATIAVFVALGGSGYAAVALQRNSVKGKHIARNAITSPKVKNRSLKRKDFALGQLPKGDPGPRGEKGEKGDQGSPGPGEETAITYRDVDSSPATNKTTLFTGDGLILKASCGGAVPNLVLWAESTVDDGILTFTKIAGSTASETRNSNLDPVSGEYAFGGVNQNSAAGGTISWTTPGGAQVSATWHGNGPGASTPCRFDALVLRHH
jgi:hypothetical protein